MWMLAPLSTFVQIIFAYFGRGEQAVAPACIRQESELEIQASGAPMSQ